MRRSQADSPCAWPLLVLVHAHFDACAGDNYTGVLLPFAPFEWHAARPPVPGFHGPQDLTVCLELPRCPPHMRYQALLLRADAKHAFSAYASSAAACAATFMCALPG